MPVRVCLFLLIVLLPTVTDAGPISPGSWSGVPSPGAKVATGQPAFWDGASWDGPSLNVGNLLTRDFGDGLEFLHDGSGGAVPFRFDATTLEAQLLYSITDWSNGVLGFVDGIFHYDSGTGRLSDSWSSAEQYALFRRVEEDGTRYFMGIEDILRSEVTDGDHNDYVVTFFIPREVAEPASLALVGTGLALIGLRRRHLRLPEGGSRDGDTPAGA